MKRWMILLVAIVFMVSGCTKSPDPAEPSPEQAFDNSGEKVVVYRGDRNFILSLAVDGAQQIENGVYWYYELTDSYEKDWEELFYTYDLKKQELNGSVQYDRLKNCFATNGNWPLFLNPVHTEYLPSNQADVDPSYISCVEQQLSANQMEGASVLITDVWKCDLDGDGAQEAIFKACNCSEKNQAVSYCFLGFAAGESCQGIYSLFSSETPYEDARLTPLVCDLNGDGKWSLLLRKKGDYESFITYDFSNGNFTKSYEIIF